MGDPFQYFGKRPCAWSVPEGQRNQVRQTRLNQHSQCALRAEACTHKLQCPLLPQQRQKAGVVSCRVCATSLPSTQEVTDPVRAIGCKILTAPGQPPTPMPVARKEYGGLPTVGRAISESNPMLMSQIWNQMAGPALFRSKCLQTGTNR